MDILRHRNFSVCLRAFSLTEVVNQSLTAVRGRVEQGIDSGGVCYMFVREVEIVKVEEEDGSELENGLMIVIFQREGNGVGGHRQ